MQNRVWILYDGCDIPPVSLWVQFGVNMYEMKKVVLKDPDTPKVFSKVAPYDVTVYCQQRKIEDDVLVEDVHPTRVEPLVFSNEECKYVVAFQYPLKL